MEFCDGGGVAYPSLSEEEAIAEHACVAVRFTAQADMDIFQSWLPKLVRTALVHGESVRYMLVADYLGVMMHSCSIDNMVGATKFSKYMLGLAAMYGIYQGARQLTFDKTVGASSPLTFARQMRDAVMGLPGDSALLVYFHLGSSYFDPVGVSCTHASSIYTVLTWGNLVDEATGTLGTGALLEYLHCWEGRAGGDEHGARVQIQRGELENGMDDAGLLQPRLRGDPRRDVGVVVEVLYRLQSSVPVQLQLWEPDPYARMRQYVRNCEYLIDPTRNEEKAVRHAFGRSLSFFDEWYAHIAAALFGVASSAEAAAFIEALQRAAASTRGWKLTDLRELNRKLKDHQNWLELNHVKLLPVPDRIGALEARLREGALLANQGSSLLRSGPSSTSEPIPPVRIELNIENIDVARKARRDHVVLVKRIGGGGSPTSHIYPTTSAITSGRARSV